MRSFDTGTSRRNFLLAACAAGAATVTAIGATTLPQQPWQPGEKEKNEREAGYKLSEHVRNYYRTTLV